jgi:hypothetical protein
MRWMRPGRSFTQRRSKNNGEGKDIFRLAAGPIKYTSSPAHQAGQIQVVKDLIGNMISVVYCFFNHLINCYAGAPGKGLKPTFANE